MEKYRLVSVGDSLTQGFQSFAVFNRGQKYSFPNQIVNANSDRFLPFKTPYVPYPGYPFNIEHFLNQLQEWNASGASWLARLKLARGLMRDLSSYGLPHPRNHQRHHNLAVHGYTARDLFETTFRKRAAPLQHLLLREKGALRKSRALEPFDSFNFARATHNVLCGSEADVDRAALDIACDIIRGEQKSGRECLVTYWAGNNDVLGALVSGDQRFITDPKIVLFFIRKSLERLLEHPNARVACATLPEATYAPFLDEKTGIPLFPVYQTISAEANREIRAAIEQINAGIREIHRSIASDRLGLVESDVLFSELLRKGCPVRVNERNLCLTADYLELDEAGKMKNGGLLSLDGIHPTSTAYSLLANAFIASFRELGADLAEVNVEAIACQDSLVMRPPALIPQYLDASSDLRKLAAKINLFPFIQTLISKQFDFKMRDPQASPEAI